MLQVATTSCEISSMFCKAKTRGVHFPALVLHRGADSMHWLQLTQPDAVGPSDVVTHLYYANFAAMANFDD